jgi:WD40 repeat protein
LTLSYFQGASANVEDKFFRSPLWIAAMLGRSEFVKELIEHGANIDYSNESRTPLYIAVHNNHIEVVKLLLQHNADTEIADRAGKRPIDVAEEFQFLELKALLMSQGSVVSIKKMINYRYSMQAQIIGKIQNKIINIREIAENSQLWVFTNDYNITVFSSKTNKFLGSFVLPLPDSNIFYGDQIVVVNGKYVWCLFGSTIYVLVWNKLYAIVDEDMKRNPFIEMKEKCITLKKVLKLFPEQVHTIFLMDRNMYGLVTPSSVIVWSVKTFEVITKIQLFMSIFPTIKDCQCRVSLGVGLDKSIFISVRNIVYVFEDANFSSHYTLSGESDHIKTMVTTSNRVYTTGRFDFMLRIWDIGQRDLVSCVDNAKYDLLFKIAKDRFSSNHMCVIKVWDKDFGPVTEFTTPHLEGISTMHWSSKANRCWIAGNDNSISMWLLQLQHDK